MKNSAGFGVKMFLFALPSLWVGSQSVKADVALAAGRQLSSRSDLGASTQDLLARYGKPTAVCFLADSPPLSPPPSGVAQFQPHKAPNWAQSVLFSLKGTQRRVIWLYKQDSTAVSFLIDPLSRTEASCVAGSSGTPIAANGQKFNVFPSPTVALGDEVRKVINRYGYPANIRSLGKSLFELDYESQQGAFKKVVLTIRENRIARIYHYEDLDSSFVQPKPRSKYQLLKNN